MPPLSGLLLIFSLFLGLPASRLLAAVEEDEAEETKPMPMSGPAVDMLYRNWTASDGLPHNRVRAVIQSRDGFLWLGTDAGLARFDGFDFQTWSLEEGLGAPAVFSLCEADDGTLYIGTQGGGLSAMRDGRIVRTWTTSDGLLSNSVDRIIQDGEGTLWAGGIGFLVRLENDRFVTDGPQPERATAMALDKAGRLWTSSPWHRRMRMREKGAWKEVEEGPDPHPRKALSMTRDSQGGIWIFDAAGAFWSLPDPSGPWVRKSPDFTLREVIRSMAVDASGTVWITLPRRGLAGWKGDGWILPVERGAYTQDLAETINCPGGELLWLTSASGIFSITPLELEICRVPGPVPRTANDIGGLVEETPGTFLLATQGSGFYRWRDGRAQPLTDDPALSRPVNGNALWKAGDGSVWLAAQTGIFQFRDGKEVARPAMPGSLRETWVVTGGKSCALWAGLARGHVQSLGSDGRLQELPNPNTGRDPVKAVHEQNDGTLWIGTRGGGLYRRGADGQWRRFGKEDGLRSEVIRFLIPVAGDGSRDGLWIGTAGAGLVLYRDGKFSGLTRAAGLPDDTISQLVKDDAGRFWAGTGKGLAIFSVEESARMERGDFSQFYPMVLNAHDGLPSEEFTIVPPFKAHDGRLVFATNRGFLRLDPARFQKDRTQPRVYLESVVANGVPVRPVNGGLTLPPETERLEFAFTALHFPALERLRFHNRLAGLEKDWGGVSAARRAEYRNLRPGTYEFQVAATIGNGIWSDEPATLRFTVLPYFWQTWWFRTAMVALVLVLVGLAVRFRERRRARRRIEALEKEQAVQSERARIARDLHDDVGASLTQVALLSELARGDLTEDPGRADDTIQEIFSTARELTRSLDEIVWAVNPAHDTVAGLMAYVGTSAQSYCRSAGLAVRLDFPANPPGTALSSPVRHHLCLGVREALHNAVKHSGASAVRLSLRVDDGDLCLSVEDNGQGLSAEARQSRDGDGLGNFHSRMRQIGGRCDFSTPADGGLQVNFRVPLTG